MASFLDKLKGFSIKDRQFVLFFAVLFTALFLIFNDLSVAYIGSDAQGYCAYLGSWVIYQDFDFSFYSTIPDYVKDRYWLNSYGDYPPFPKYTMGVAILQLPAYLLAHFYSLLFSSDTDGWGSPYHIAVGLNGILFFVLGINYLLKILRRYFSTMASRMSIVLLVFGSNIFYYAIFENAMSHIYSFSLFAIAFHFFLNWIERKSLKALLISSFAFGLFVLIRPVNGVLLIPVLAIYLEKQSFKISRQDIVDLFKVLPFFLAPLLLQSFFWHEMTGEWFFYTYGPEKILWDNPQIIKGLFSYRNGWLIYTPLMFFAIIGLLKLPNQLKVSKWVIITSLGLYFYVVFSWWVWFYGASFSIRPMIDAYVIMSLGLTAILQWLPKVRWLRISSFMLAAFLITHNLVESYHYVGKRISGSDMTKAAYWDLFMDFSSTSNGQLLGYYEKPDYDMLLIGREERAIQSTTIKQWEKTEADTVSNEIKYGQVFSIPFEDSSYDENLYYKVTLDISADYNSHAQAVVAFELKDGEDAIDYYALRVQREVGQKERETVRVFVPKPNFEVKDGSLLILPWIVKGKFKMIVHSIKVELIRKEFVSK